MLYIRVGTLVPDHAFVDLQVYFTDMPDMKVYVKSYGGWMISAVAKLKSQQLKTSLDNVQASYETDYHYNVGYNR